MSQQQIISGTPSTYRPLVVVLAAACFGVVLDRSSGWPVWFWWPSAMIAWIIWWTLWRRERTWWAAWGLLVSVAATGATWHHCRWSLFADDHVVLAAREDAGPAAIEAVATSGPRRVPAPLPDELRPIATPERTRLEIEVLAIRDQSTWRPASGRVSLMVDGHVFDVRPGERLRIFGQFGAYQSPANPGEFDFAALARAAGRLCWLRCEFPECITRRGGGWHFVPPAVVDFLRTRGDELLWRNLGPAHRGLASAMFLGARQELDPETAQAFVETGTIHLLVVSGLNVGILATFLFLIMRIGLVPRRWALAIVVVASVLYAAATDAQPPVVRATVMVLVGCLGMVLSRRPLGFNSLAAAGLVVLAINPAELFQAGTQLSFLAVGVLVYFAGARSGRRKLDPLDRLIAATRPWQWRAARGLLGWARQITLATTLIWLAVCPLVMARFHLVSPAAIVLGPLLAVPVTLAMGSAFGIFLFGWLVPPLGMLLGAVCDANLSLLQICVETARRLPLSHFWVSGPGNWWLIGFYAALGCWALVPAIRPSGRWCLAMVAGWVALGLLTSLVPARPGDQLECAFLSVGHGTAVVVELPGGQTLLYDAGRLGSPIGASRAVSGFLWSRSITHLDAIVISHADLDHYNAVPALLEQFSVGAVYVSPVMFDEPSRALAALRAAIDSSGVPLRTVWSGDRLHASGGARIEVLHPPRRGVLGSDNANSIVLAIEYRGRRLLLTGDLESPGLDDVMAELPYDCDVVMAPHHGSASSDPPGFADWSRPEWTVVSGGASDRTRAVQAAYEARGSRVLHTADRGAVRVTIAGDQLSVDCWREDRSGR
jgi:competence protein ComEC